jgi:hypothetical protein
VIGNGSYVDREKALEQSKNNNNAPGRSASMEWASRRGNRENRLFSYLDVEKLFTIA